MKSMFSQAATAETDAHPARNKAAISVVLLSATLGMYLLLAPTSWPLIESFNMLLARVFSGPGGGAWWVLAALAAGLMLMTCRIIRRQPRKTIRNSHAYLMDGLKQAIETTSIVSICRPDGKYVYVNDNFVEAFGYTVDDLEKARNFSVYEKGAADGNYREIVEHTAKGKTWIGKQRLRTKSGKFLVSNATVVPVYDESGRISHSICIRSNVTSQEEENTAVMMRSLLGNLEDAIFLFDTEALNIIFANRSACELSGWREDEFCAKRIPEWSRKFDEDAFWAKVGTPLLDGSQEAVVVEVQHENGPVSISTKLWTTPCGRTVFLSIARDISAQRMLDRARIEAVSEISHELRTPLTSIKGSLRLMESGAIGGLSNQAQQVLGIASRNTDRLLHIINDILTVQKIEAGKLECEMRPIDLAEILKEAVTANIGFCDEHDVRLEFVPTDDEAMVTGDSARVIQVLTNLISNAAKHSPEGGSVKVELIDRGSAWRLSVRDNGPGIPDEARGKIFERFGQIKATDGIVRSGTGLGLTICEKIIEIHNGQIDYTSVVGQGSDFFFDLPKLKEKHDNVEACRRAV